MISHDLQDFAASDLARFMDSSRISLSITSCELEDHPLIYVNEAFCDLTGYRRDDAVGQNCRFLQRELREQDARFRIREFLKNDKREHLRCPIINFRADGSPFVNLVYLTKIRTFDTRSRFVFASQFDVTRYLPEQFDSYDESLALTAKKLRSIASEHDLIVDQSMDVIAQTTASIAESKLALARLSVASGDYR